MYAFDAGGKSLSSLDGSTGFAFSKRRLCFSASSKLLIFSYVSEELNYMRASVLRELSLFINRLKCHVLHHLLELLDFWLGVDLLQTEADLFRWARRLCVFALLRCRVECLHSVVFNFSEMMEQSQSESLCYQESEASTIFTHAAEFSALEVSARVEDNKCVLWLQLKLRPLILH